MIRSDGSKDVIITITIYSSSIVTITEEEELTTQKYSTKRGTFSRSRALLSLVIRRRVSTDPPTGTPESDTKTETSPKMTWKLLSELIRLLLMQ